MVQVDVQQRRAGGVDAAAQRRLDQVDVVEALGPVQVDDQMHACATHAVADREMIVALLDRRRRDHGNLIFFGVSLSGGAWSLRPFPDRKRALGALRPPQPVIQPECRRAGASERQRLETLTSRNTNVSER